MAPDATMSAVSRQQSASRHPARLALWLAAAGWERPLFASRPAAAVYGIMRGAGGSSQPRCAGARPSAGLEVVCAVVHHRNHVLIEVLAALRLVSARAARRLLAHG